MILIPTGAFIMGSPASEAQRDGDEGPTRRVTVSSFYMAEYELTVAEFRQFVNATGYKTEAERLYGGWVCFDDVWVMKADASWLNPYMKQSDLDPVVLVSWHDAVEYCNWRSVHEGLTPAFGNNGADATCDWTANGYRLPTEAEWEYACRAGTTTPFSTGTDIATSQANYDGDYPYNTTVKGEYRKRTLPVGSFEPNAWGLYDMHGNVWEWCWDWYADHYDAGPATDPRGASSGEARVYRGGGWNILGRFLRSANRDRNFPSSRDDALGFRLVRSGSPGTV